ELVHGSAWPVRPVLIIRNLARMKCRSRSLCRTIPAYPPATFFYAFCPAKETPMQTRRTLLALLCLTAAACPALAQDRYPSRPVKVISPAPAGSAADVRGRLIAHELGRTWGQQTVVENRPGAGGILGVQAALSAPA